MEEEPIFVKRMHKSLKTDQSNQKSYLKILQNIRGGIQRKPYRVLMPKRERQNPRIIRKEKRKNLRMHNKILSFWQQQRRIKMRTICRNHPVIFSPIPFSAPRGLGLSTFCVIRMVSLLHTSSFTSSWKKYTLLLLEYSNSFFFFFLAVPPRPLGS